MPFTAFHFSLYCLIGLRLLACVVVVTLKLDFLKKMYGHLSDKSLCIILDNDNLIYVTSSEVLNAAVILGSCDACTAGKIVTPSFKSSQQEPASSVREHLYMDLLELKERTIGGYLWFLVSIDEFSSYLMIVGFKT